MNSEIRFLLAWLKSGNYDYLLQKGITKDFFLLHDDIFDYICEHFKKYKKLPNISIVENKFEDFEDEKITELLDFYADELEADYTKQSVINILNESAESVEGDDIDKSITILQNGIKVIGERMTGFSSFDLAKIGDDRLKNYEKLKKLDGMLGLPTGVPELDQAWSGYQKGNIYGVFAHRKVGKTWFLICTAIHLMKLGYKILFFTKEQVKDIIAHRAEAVLFNLPYKRFSKYKLKPEEEKKWYKERRAFKTKGFLEIIDNTEHNKSDINFVESMIARFNPDMVMIDGITLYGKGGGVSVSWDLLTELSRSAKQVCMRNRLPIMYSAHYSRKDARENKKKQTMTLDEIALSDAFGQDCDGSIGLFQTEMMKKRHRMDVYIMAAREAKIDKFSLQWNIDDMDMMNSYQDMNIDLSPDIDDEGDESLVDKVLDMI